MLKKAQRIYDNRKPPRHCSLCAASDLAFRAYILSNQSPLRPGIRLRYPQNVLRGGVKPMDIASLPPPSSRVWGSAAPLRGCTWFP